jgi:putative PIN family toxin of toxin-antitoxin system
MASQDVRLFSSPAMIAELRHSLGYPKLVQQLAKNGQDAEGLIGFYSAIIHLVEPQHVERFVANDPDDDMVVAAAHTASAAMIVSGDRHLLELDSSAGVAVLSVVEALEVLQTRRGPL